MSQIVRCVACDERVRMPDVSSDAWVRCPFCNEEYQLKQLAKDLPPRMEVLGGPTVVIESGTEPDGAAITELASVPRHDATVDAPLIPDLGEDAAKVRSPLHANRTKTKQASGAWAFAKVALGGIAGLAIGQLLLWWLPEPYRSDPLDLAGKLPTQANFLLPKGMRNGGLMLPPADEAQFDTSITNEQEVIDDPIAVPSVVVSEGKPTAGQAIPETDLRYSLQTAVAEDVSFNEFGSTSKHAKVWYDGMCQLASCVTNIESLDRVDVVVRDMTKFLIGVGADKRKVDTMAKLNVEQITSDTSIDGSGIASAGKVTRIQPAGELFRTELQLAGSNSLVDIISRSDPVAEKSYLVGDSIVVLGVLVKKPVELFGYKGPDRPVMLSGFPLKVDEFTP